MKRRGNTIHYDRYNKMKKGKLYAITIQPKPVDEYTTVLRAVQEERMKEDYETQKRLTLELKKDEGE